MKRWARKTASAAVAVWFMFSGVSIAQVPVPGVTPPQNQHTEERKAAETLARLGVPLQRDVEGVVRWIEAAKGEMSDEAIGHLPALPKLEWLEIGGGRVSAAGLVPLKKCVSLRRLYIHDVRLDNDELAWLSDLTGLEALSLQRTGISGRILKNIKAVDTLKVLNLSGNGINDADMDFIAPMKGLEVLALADTKITGAGIAKLQGMARLNELNVARCAVHDADVEFFLTMPNLRIVYAEGCGIGDMAIEEMKYRFPMLAIFR
jgi:hypothetical protein